MILNQIPIKSVFSTQYKLWSGNKPSIHYLHPWGSNGYVNVPSNRLRKLGHKASKHVFIRYPDNAKGYVMYVVST